MIDLTLLPRPIYAVAIGTSPQTRKIVTTVQERAAIAETLDLVDLATLDAQLELRRDGRGRIHVEGRVTADIVQSCVVSLEPVPQHIDEPIALVFIEADAVSAEARPGVEIRVDPAKEDPPEALTGSTLDLGPIVMEHFVLAIDPYPRAAGAEVPEIGERGADSPESPFAVLAKLKEKPGGK
jgi:uncharacterized metal-binding protein YceD (DUF177 family)